MKNKGFTLIEMLAVITILGVISLVAIWGGSSVLNNARKESYKNFENNMKNASRNYFTTNVDKIPLNNTSCVISLNSLITKGLSQELNDPNGNDDDNNKCNYQESYVLVTRIDSSDNLNLEYRICLKCDNYLTTYNDVNDYYDCSIYPSVGECIDE